MRGDTGRSIGNAIIWAAVILATAILLKGTPQAGSVIAIIGGGAGGSIAIMERGRRRGQRCWW